MGSRRGTSCVSRSMSLPVSPRVDRRPAPGLLPLPRVQEPWITSLRRWTGGLRRPWTSMSAGTLRWLRARPDLGQESSRRSTRCDCWVTAWYRHSARSTRYGEAPTTITLVQEQGDRLTHRSSSRQTRASIILMSRLIRSAQVWSRNVRACPALATVAASSWWARKYLAFSAHSSADRYVTSSSPGSNKSARLDPSSVSSSVPIPVASKSRRLFANPWATSMWWLRVSRDVASTWKHLDSPGGAMQISVQG